MRRTSIPAALFLALALGGPAFAGPLEDGIEAIDHGDYNAAVRLLRPLAEAGNPEAQINLANLYFDGNGVRQSYTESVKWYLLAANHGSNDAQIALGFLYQYGEAMPPDYVQAYKWFELADSPANRDIVATMMNPAQIMEAQTLARDWRAN